MHKMGSFIPFWFFIGSVALSSAVFGAGSLAREDPSGMCRHLGELQSMPNSKAWVAIAIWPSCLSPGERSVPSLRAQDSASGSLLCHHFLFRLFIFSKHKRCVLLFAAGRAAPILGRKTPAYIVESSGSGTLIDTSTNKRNTFLKIFVKKLLIYSVSLTCLYLPLHSRFRDEHY